MTSFATFHKCLCKQFKAVYTVGKLGTNLLKKEYRPHIFARVNNPYHVLGDGYARVFFLVLGP